MGKMLIHITDDFRFRQEWAVWPSLIRKTEAAANGESATDASIVCEFLLQLNPSITIHLQIYTCD